MLNLHKLLPFHNTLVHLLPLPAAAICQASESAHLLHHCHSHIRHVLVAQL